MFSRTESHTLWRIALELQRQYEARESREAEIFREVLDRWQELQNGQRRLTMAQKHQLCHATTVCRHRLISVLQPLLQNLKVWSQQLQTQDRTASPIQPNAIYDELFSLFDEFEQVNADQHQKTVSVRTERIVLKDIDLGSFEIRLSVRDIFRLQPYRVIALEPTPCASAPDTKHPHVLSDKLCEGDGQLAIRQALTEGRLHDFFVLVRQVLRSYNASSAYHALDNWFGTACVDCDDVVSDNDGYGCERCGGNVCNSCVASCTSCGNTLCSGCRCHCPACSTPICDRCQTPCDECGESACNICLEAGLCSACQQPLPENTDVETSSSILTSSLAATSAPDTDATATVPAVQPDGLGETAVPA